MSRTPMSAVHPNSTGAAGEDEPRADAVHGFATFQTTLLFSVTQ